jgi:hypothetical protein
VLSWSPLPREEVIKAIERRNPVRVPLIFARWWGEGLWDHFGDRLLEFERYPDETMPGMLGYLRQVVPRSVRRADCVIADSEATRRDLIGKQSHTVVTPLRIEGP